MTEDHLDIYVPGRLRCPQCEFVLSQATMFMGSGTIGLTKAQAFCEDEGQPCPNDGTPMVKVRWREEAEDNYRAYVKLVEDVLALTGAPSLPEALDALKRPAKK